MMNTPKTLTAGLLGIGLLFALPAQATILSDELTFDGPVHHDLFNGTTPFQGGGEDKLQDDSLSAYIDTGDAGFTDGDIIWGVVTLSEINSSGALNSTIGDDEQIAIIFSAEIDGAGAGGSFNLVPTTDATYSLSALLTDSIEDAASLDSDSIAVVVSTDTLTNGAATSGTNDPLDWSTAEAQTLFDNTYDWFWEATLGIVDDDDFFEFLGSSIIGGTELGAFTITSQAFTTEWIDVDVLDFGGTVHFGDATLNPGTVSIASGDEITRGWTFTDQGSYYVNPFREVPEPSIIALLGMSFAGIGFIAMRRRAKIT